MYTENVSTEYFEHVLQISNEVELGRSFPRQNQTINNKWGNCHFKYVNAKTTLWRIMKQGNDQRSKIKTLKPTDWKKKTEMNQLKQK